MRFFKVDLPGQFPPPNKTVLSIPFCTVPILCYLLSARTDETAQHDQKAEVFLNPGTLIRFRLIGTAILVFDSATARAEFILSDRE